jgi:hypothetical protein
LVHSVCIWIRWLSGLGPIISAVVALAIAVFHAQLRSILWRPKLRVELQNSPPDCHRTKYNWQDRQADCYYFRIRVKNDGNAPAEYVEVFLEKILLKLADGRWESLKGFLPMNLCWAHIGIPYYPKIFRDTYKHCDVGHIIDPAKRSGFPNEDHESLKAYSNKAIMSLDLIVRPYTGGHLLKPGIYKLIISVGAANARPNKRSIDLNLTGNWTDNEQDMLTTGVGFGPVGDGNV